MTLPPLWLALPIAGAATIDVTTTDDVVADDGLCSLREALAAARDQVGSGSSAGECAAGDAGTDEIALPAGTSFPASTLTIDSEVSLVGQGMGITVIDGGDTVEIFRASADLALTGLTVQHAYGALK
ncbi:MAG: CSLREA domain-containing protein, partial [Myxococcales bacterium]|nr:CSLREA domain-containing protein [Myxococcales bacterium]